MRAESELKPLGTSPKHPAMFGEYGGKGQGIDGFFYGGMSSLIKNVQGLYKISFWGPIE